MVNFTDIMSLSVREKWAVLIMADCMRCHFKETCRLAARFNDGDFGPAEFSVHPIFPVVEDCQREKSKSPGAFGRQGTAREPSAKTDQANNVVTFPGSIANLRSPC